MKMKKTISTDMEIERTLVKDIKGLAMMLSR